MALLKESPQLSTLTTRRQFLAGVAATAVVSRVAALRGGLEPAGAWRIHEGIFGASFGVGWLYEMRLGLDGVITGTRCTPI